LSFQKLIFMLLKTCLGLKGLIVVTKNIQK
jgi:hypothetical protein